LRWFRLGRFFSLALDPSGKKISVDVEIARKKLPMLKLK